MGLKIIRRATPITIHIDGSAFHFKKLPPDEEVVALRRYNQGGEDAVNLPVIYETLSKTCTGWDNVEVDGQPMPYDPARVKELIEELPAMHAVNLFNVVMGISNANPTPGTSSPPSDGTSNGTPAIPA